MRVFGLRPGSSPTPGVDLGGLVPNPDSAVLGWLLFVCSDFHDFRTHGPRMRLKDIYASSGIFLTRASSSATTVDRRPCRGQMVPTLSTVFASAFAAGSEGGTDPCDAPAAVTKLLRNRARHRQCWGRLSPGRGCVPHAEWLFLDSGTVPPNSATRLVHGRRRFGVTWENHREYNCGWGMLLVGCFG